MTLRLSILLLAFFSNAYAGTVNLSGDYGCDLPATAKKRQFMIEEQLSPLPEVMKRRPQIRADLVAITDQQCKPLTGTFTVTARQDGLIQVDTEYGPLWVSGL